MSKMPRDSIFLTIPIFRARLVYTVPDGLCILAAGWDDCREFVEIEFCLVNSLPARMNRTNTR